MNRRDFVLSGATAAMAAMAPLSRAAFDGGAAGLATIPLHRVVFDERFSASAEFGRAARAGRATVVGIRGDVTQLWRSQLGPYWATGESPRAVAGMTSPASLLCLEQMARDHWLRVTVRVDHSNARAGMPGHRVTAAQPAFTPVCRAMRDARWPSRLGQQFLTCPRGRVTTPLITWIPGGPGAEGESDLVSWIISA